MRHPAAFTIEGPAGPLECLLRLPDRSPRLAALLCHPHPLHGGTMHSKVVYRLARALQAEAAAVLRCNFRGVGASAGRHDHGRGELEDARFALDHLAARFPGLPLLLGGFSFGAWVALRLAAVDERAAALVGVGLGTTVHGFDEAHAVARPKLIVQGGADDLGPEDQVRRVAAMLAPPVELVVIAGADHFLSGRLDELEAAVKGFVRSLDLSPARG